MNEGGSFTYTGTIVRKKELMPNEKRKHPWCQIVIGYMGGAVQFTVDKAAYDRVGQGQTVTLEGDITGGGAFNDPRLNVRTVRAVEAQQAARPAGPRTAVASLLVLCSLLFGTVQQARAAVPEGWPETFSITVTNASPQNLNGSYELSWDDTLGQFSNGDRPNPGMFLTPFGGPPPMMGSGLLRYDDGAGFFVEHTFGGHMTPGGFFVSGSSGPYFTGPGNLPGAGSVAVPLLLSALSRRSSARSHSTSVQAA